MALYYVHIFLNLTVLLAAAAALLRKRLMPVYLFPFCLLLLIASCNELLSLYLVTTKRFNAVNGNSYVLLEFLLLCLQFHYWAVLSRSKLVVCVSIGIIIWCTDNFVFSAITNNNSLSRISFAFLFVFFSIDMINRHIVFGKDSRYNISTLIIVIGLLMFFACKAYVEVFNAFNLGFSTAFYAHIWFTLSVVNAAVNIMYTIAMLCIPRKQEFLWPSS